MKELKNPERLREPFVRTLYDVLSPRLSPTPYLLITEGDKVGIQFLDGRGKLPANNTTEITTLDLNIASLFFDNFKLLYEGITGVGKTHTTDALFSTLFGPDGYCTLRLSGGVFGNSALQPFTTTVLENGIPKTVIDSAKCNQYGGLFIDEINRGDNNETFQVVDGKINVGGQSALLGLPIQGTDRLKKLALIAAMNPAEGDYTGALPLDLAGENRFLKFRYPNGVQEAGSSQLEKKVAGDLHTEFWKRFCEKTGVEGTWKELYPVITDPLHMELGSEGLEVLDVLLGYVGHDPLETFTQNKELAEQCGYPLRSSVTKNNELDRARTAQQNLKHGFVRRDLEKMYDLSCLLGLIKSIKNGTYQPKVTLNDLVASLAITLESKRAKEGSLQVLVDDGLLAYRKIKETVGAEGKPYGIRPYIFQTAVLMGKKGFAAYLDTLQKALGKLNMQYPSVAGATIGSRIIADLAVLEHFSKEHKDELDAALKSKDPFAASKKVYDQHRHEASIYDHRLSSVIK